MVSSLSSPPALAQHQHQHPPHSTELKGQGGEGGEGGEGSNAASVATDVDLLVVLEQMQGHMLIAQELLQQRQFKAAEPHVGHPVDELYGAIAPALQQRRIPPFLDVLEELRQQVRIDPASPATAAKWSRAQQAIASAAASVPPSVRFSPMTVTGVVRKLAEAAASEYRSAEASGRIVEVIEYQDARGFLLAAQRFLAASSARQATTAAELKPLDQGVQSMLRAFPSAIPPAKALISADKLELLEKAL